MIVCSFMFCFCIIGILWVKADLGCCLASLWLEGVPITRFWKWVAESCDLTPAQILINDVAIFLAVWLVVSQEILLCGHFGGCTSTCSKQWQALVTSCDVWSLLQWYIFLHCFNLPMMSYLKRLFSFVTPIFIKLKVLSMGLVTRGPPWLVRALIQRVLK